MCTQRPTLLIQSQIIASFSQKWYYISPTFYRISVSLQKLSCSISRRRLRKLGLTTINNNFTFHELKSSQFFSSCSFCFTLDFFRWLWPKVSISLGAKLSMACACCARWSKNSKQIWANGMGLKVHTPLLLFSVSRI